MVWKWKRIKLLSGNFLNIFFKEKIELIYNEKENYNYFDLCKYYYSLVLIIVLKD